MRRHIASWVVVITITGGAYTAQVRSSAQVSLRRAQAARPMLGSPLVASADRLFAIADDQRHILVSPAAVPAAWRVFDPDGPAFGRLAGLASWTTGST